MTDTSSPAQSNLPSWFVTIVTLVARHGLTWFSGFLAVHGAIQASQGQSFIELGLSVVLWAAGIAFSLGQKFLSRTKLVAALNAPKANPPVKP